LACATRPDQLSFPTGATKKVTGLGASAALTNRPPDKPAIIKTATGNHNLIVMHSLLVHTGLQQRSDNAMMLND
jgi:hypothetical protein